jgi:transposase-like protein
MSPSYSPAFIEQALVRVFSRGERSIAAIAQELNLSHYTLKHWMRKKVKSQPISSSDSSAAGLDKRPHDWKPAEQLLALMQTHSLSEEERNAWCRERGLFAHHLVTWQHAFSNTSSSTAEQQKWRGLQDQNHQLKRELVRKEKALAEAAALLVLQKKFRAMWEDEAK